MLLVAAVILAILLIQVFVWVYRTKNVRLSEQQLQTQPTPNAVFEGVVRRWFQFTWNIPQLLTAYNAPSHTGGRLVLVNQQLLLFDAKQQQIFQLPVATLKINWINAPNVTYVWIFADQSHKYQVRLLQKRNLLKQLGPYQDLEQALVKVRGFGYSNASKPLA